jgi:hypothetical protein
MAQERLDFPQVVVNVENGLSHNSTSGAFNDSIILGGDLNQSTSINLNSQNLNIGNVYYSGDYLGINTGGSDLTANLDISGTIRVRDFTEGVVYASTSGYLTTDFLDLGDVVISNAVSKQNHLTKYLNNTTNEITDTRIVDNGSQIFLGSTAGLGVGNRHNEIVEGYYNILTTGDAQHTSLMAHGYTTTTTPEELFLDDSSARITLTQSSLLSFAINIIGVDIVTDDCKTMRFEGGIKRTSAGTEFVGGSSTKITTSSDFLGGTNGIDIDAEITADDTNHSLKVEVTGTSNPTKWVAHIDLVETKWV